MDPKPAEKLLNFETVVTALNLPPADVEYLVHTGQLPEIRIRGNRLFDQRDLLKLIELYKRVQNRRNDDAW